MFGVRALDSRCVGSRHGVNAARNRVPIFSGIRDRQDPEHGAGPRDGVDHHRPLRGALAAANNDCAAPARAHLGYGVVLSYPPAAIAAATDATRRALSRRSCFTPVQNGANPQALAAVVEELRREGAALEAASTQS